MYKTHNLSQIIICVNIIKIKLFANNVPAFVETNLNKNILQNIIFFLDLYSEND